MSKLLAHWNEVTQLLREARNCLPTEQTSLVTSSVPVGPLTGTVDEFEEFLGQNELELAWDTLEAVAERVNAPPECWRKLAQAASLMGLPRKEKAAAQRAK